MFPARHGFPDMPRPRSVDLPLAEVEVHIDDARHRIDDAFSVSKLPDGSLRIGIHIAAPALGITPGSAIDAVARTRLSTVYFPGGKITMLPDAAIGAYTLSARTQCPALSLYLEVAPGGAIVARTTRVERVSIAENLRHTVLEEALNEATLAAGRVEHRYGEELAFLWRFVRALEEARRGAAPEQEQRPEYSFYVENDRVRIVQRRRGTPIDKIVSELMIQANSAWGRDLAQNGAAAIYRGRTAARSGWHGAAGTRGSGDSYAWASRRCGARGA